MTKRNFLTLLLLALLFIAPGITAYLYYLHPQWLGSTTTNKGAWLNPPLILEPLAQSKKKWHLVLWYPQDCQASCLQAVDKLARIRLALGRHLYEVEQWLALPAEYVEEVNQMAEQFSKQDIRTIKVEQGLLTHVKEPSLFIANPQGYLILTYPESVNPKDLFHDIKQLLNTSKQS